MWVFRYVNEVKQSRVCGVTAPLFQKNPKLFIKRQLKQHTGPNGDSMFRTDGSTGGLFPNWTVSFQTSVVIKKEVEKVGNKWAILMNSLC